MTAQLNFESQRGQQSRNGDDSRKGHERTIMDSNGEKKASQVRAIFGGPGRLRHNLIGVILTFVVQKLKNSQVLVKQKK